MYFEIFIVNENNSPNEINSRIHEWFIFEILKHCATSNICVSMGNTLKKDAIQISDTMFELRNKVQIIVALRRTKLGKTLF